MEAHHSDRECFFFCRFSHLCRLLIGREQGPLLTFCNSFEQMCARANILVFRVSLRREGAVVCDLSIIKRSTRRWEARPSQKYTFLSLTVVALDAAVVCALVCLYYEYILFSVYGNSLSFSPIRICDESANHMIIK